MCRGYERHRRRADSIKQAEDPVVVFLLAIGEKVTDETLRGYLSDLNKFEKYFERQYNCPFDPKEVDKQDVVSFIRWLQRDIGHHNNTVRRIHCCLRSAFYEWFLLGMCFDNPAKGVKLVPAVKSVRMYLEAEEVNRLIAAIDDPTIKMATQILAYAGLRIEECVCLRMMDVHLDQKILHVEYGKGRQTRDVPIYPTLYRALKRYWTKRNVQVQGEHRLLATKTGRLSQSYYTKRLHEVTDRLGWSREITAHVLRHSFATDLVVRNVHVTVIQDLLGHNDLRATQVYLHAPMHLKRRAVNSLYS